MTITTNFNKATLETVSLAKIGNPLRGESLKTSKDLCQFGEEDKEILTLAFLKPFKNLERYHFHHTSDLSLHEMHCYANTIFDQDERFLTYSRKIARHLYDKTKHPNIKSGDLCIALIRGVQINGEICDAISVVKSESLTPFLEISDQDGDLQLTTHNGIYPDKIDKGCLIVDYDKDGGYLVYTFDKGGSETNFWVRDFLGARARKDDEYRTKQYASMCTSFADEGLPEEMPLEQKYRVANDAIQYMSEAETFDEKHFHDEVLREPEIIEQFTQYKDNYKDEDGEPIATEFAIDKVAAKKAGSKIKGNLKLDTGVVMKFTPDFAERESDILERGYDEKMEMKYIKVFYHEEL
ncbi:nucleoid-associated protein [Rubritalea marina]|uniref:nucleoid-associated protein n=1 Tax=Rubritalea marina TaxID=361055 RepID=UPI0003A264BF|nr:nucleoid-associated protein [Rubritalea marina]